MWFWIGLVLAISLAIWVIVMFAMDVEETLDRLDPNRRKDK